MENPHASAVTIRAYVQSDAADTLTVFTEAIVKTASADYTVEQIRAWAKPGQRDLPSWHAAMDSRGTVIAQIDAQLAGFSDCDPTGHIDMMFVSPKYLRRGVAGQLLKFVEHRARSAGLAELTSDVSITARPFFERYGFEVIAEQRPIKAGVELTNYKMRKALADRETS